MLIYFVWVLTLYVRIALRCFLMKTQWKAPLRLSISILCGATLPDSTWVILGRSEKPCLTNCDMMAKNHGDSGEFKVLTIHIYIYMYIHIHIYIHIYIYPVPIFDSWIYISHSGISWVDLENGTYGARRSVNMLFQPWHDDPQWYINQWDITGY